MKRKGWPIWLLRDIPACLGVMLSFWPLVILMINSGSRVMRGKKLSYSTFETLLILVAHAEARLAFALWRQAYRRLGWHPRGVQFHMIPVETWADAQARYNAYHVAFRNMDCMVESYVDHLRARYGIAKADLVAHGSTDARLCRAAHHEAVDVAAFKAGGSVALMVSSARSARPSNHEGVLANARGPPPGSSFPKTNPAPPQRMRA